MFDLAWLPFVATTLIAGVLRGFTGFGGALVMAPVFMTLVDPITATTIILIVNTVVGLANLREVGAETDWAIAKPFPSPAASLRRSVCGSSPASTSISSGASSR